MRRFIAVLAVALALIVSFGSRDGMAQTADSTGKFKVILGTNLWDLSRKVTGDARNWHSIFDANYAVSILDSADISVNSKGDTVVRLNPGDTILLRRDAAIRAPEAVAKTDTAKAVTIPTPTAEAPSKSSPGVFWWWLLMVVVVFGAVAFWALFKSARVEKADLLASLAAARDGRNAAQETGRVLAARLAEATRRRHPAETFTDLEVRGLATGYRRQRIDSESDGPSFIENGITSPETLTLALQRAAQIEDVRRNPDAPIRSHSLYVFRRGRRGKVMAGRYSSLFSDGTERARVIELDKPETHRHVWKATTVAPDGTEFDVYAEEICANGMAIPVNAQGDLVWEEVPEEEQTHALPASAIYVDPPAAPEAPTVEEPAPVEMVSVVAVTTPDGRTIHLPAGSTMAPVQIPASEMISPTQGSETASS